MFTEFSKLGLADIAKIEEAEKDPASHKLAVSKLWKVLRERYTGIISPEFYIGRLESELYDHICRAEGRNPLNELDHCRMADAQEVVQLHQKFMRVSKYLAKHIALYTTQEYFG